MSDSGSAPAPRRTRGRANDIDALVGSRIRQRRILLGMSQSELADALGVTFQQLQKYERGLNRVGAGRLYQASRALETPVSYFFAQPADGDVRLRADAAGDPIRQRETIELIQAYDALKSRSVKRRMLELIRALAGPAKNAPGGRDFDGNPLP